MPLIEIALTPRILPPGVRYFDPSTLKQTIEIAGITPTQFAEETGISRPMIYYLLAGDRGPTLENYLRMCARSGQPVGTWLKGIGPRVSTHFS